MRQELMPRTKIRLKTKICCPLTAEGSWLIAQSSRLLKKVQQPMALAQWLSSLLFQQMSVIAVFQNVHLMNGDFVKFFQSVALWNAFVNQDRVDVFHI